MEKAQTFPYTWEGIEMAIFFKPDCGYGIKEKGEEMSHIEVKASEPLPITETGYRSLFVHYHAVEKEGGVLPFVEGWLDEASQKPEWKEYMLKKRQLKLF